AGPVLNRHEPFRSTTQRFTPRTLFGTGLGPRVPFSRSKLGSLAAFSLRILACDRVRISAEAAKELKKSRRSIIAIHQRTLPGRCRRRSARHPAPKMIIANPHRSLMMAAEA